MTDDRRMNNWRKSTLSFSNGNCVEVASDDEEVAVRDTADRAGPVLTIPGVAWGRFIERLKAAASA